MKRLQIGDECYIRLGKKVYRSIWSETLEHYLKAYRSEIRLVYPHPVIKRLAK
jgi:hypothetical protein